MNTMPGKVTIVGAGEIGCGWAALMASAGWPVTLFDINARTLEVASTEVPRRARALIALERATPGIVERGLQELTQGRSLLLAVQGADWVIEAIPEDLHGQAEAVRRSGPDRGPQRAALELIERDAPQGHLRPVPPPGPLPRDPSPQPAGVHSAGRDRPVGTHPPRVGHPRA